jgi:MFS family permease
MGNSLSSKRDVGFNLIYLFMGLILGIIGNLLVSFYMKMIETNYSQIWIISFASSVVTLILFGIFWLRYANKIIKNPEKTEEEKKETPTQTLTRVQRLNLYLSFYETTNTLISLLASFSFVTIPFILFTINAYSYMLRLVIDSLLVSFFSFFMLIILYHSSVIRLVISEDKGMFKRRSLEMKIGDLFFLLATFFVPFSLGLMLFLKGTDQWLNQAVSCILMSFFFPTLAYLRILKGYAKDG